MQKFTHAYAFGLLALGCGTASDGALGEHAVGTSAAALDVSVLDAPYDAVGDGVTNDRPAIQRAIDTVGAAGGGTVSLPGTHAYLTGDLELRSGVTLDIGDGATLVQSQSPGDYAHTPTKGRDIPGSTVPFMTYLDQNYPLIYAGSASNVAVTGPGTIRMTYGTSDTDSILVHAIGFNLVSNYTISNVTIDGASAYNITMRNTDHGDISGVKTTHPNTLNSDGISLMNSSFVEVHDNQLTTLDDGIYVWASYADPRRSAWWNSDTPRSSHDIHVYGNVVDNQSTNGSHGFLFINWTASAPDESQVEVARISVHDNTLGATYPVAALNQDLYHSDREKTPSKDITFRNNVLTVVGNGATSKDLNGMATTDFSGDDPAYDIGLATNDTGLYNFDFDGHNAFDNEVATSFWSTEGGASAPSDDVGQPGGHYGQIAGFQNGYAGIYQGVYLVPGQYTFTVATQSSGAPIRLFAIRASNIDVTGSTSFNNTTWQGVSLTFTVTTADTYRLGIDNQGAGGDPGSFGRIDSASLVKIN